jgi:hypothetical protein
MELQEMVQLGVIVCEHPIAQKVYSPNWVNYVIKGLQEMPKLLVLIVGDHGVAKKLWPQLGVIVSDQGVARNAGIGSHYWPSSWGCKNCPNQCTLFFWLSLVIIWLFFFFFFAKWLI